LFVFRASYKDWISADIRQVLVETHLVVGEDSSNFFSAFRENNLAMFSKEVNVYTRGTCFEFSFVKLHPEFWKGSQAANSVTLPAERLVCDKE
jgi:Methyltransferase domain